VHETPCTKTFLTHACYLTYLGPEVVHREPVNYQGVQFYLCCIVHSQEGAEFCFHLDAFYEFYLENVALVGKLDNSGSNNFVLSIITPLVHSSNTCCFWEYPSIDLEITRTVGGANTRGKPFM
jgi:hypothetical protein